MKAVILLFALIGLTTAKPQFQQQFQPQIQQQFQPKFQQQVQPKFQQQFQPKGQQQFQPQFQQQFQPKFQQQVQPKFQQQVQPKFQQQFQPKFQQQFQPQFQQQFQSQVQQQFQPQFQQQFQQRVQAGPGAFIIRYDANLGVPTGFSYAVEQSDGYNQAVIGEIRNVGTDAESLAVEGQYSYIGDDGQTYTVYYTADENGFQPIGAHIPAAANTKKLGALPTHALTSLAGGGIG